ncbi:uncharacterized protein LOC105189053 [Harpegnathos saltator]|uniref:Uncharacterized protein n=1 Tax=Harpegnathos saltator TaxID=610380 RepID=E2C1X6_HARSA|nr:uncharacterized protein LOC105189053 [Harpegnathos saltator]XP_025157228.1 uncharacterized protein LOC105189053 [Harpegnathos saltator]EFN78088.1 hypothetical protein EAI_14684 [Harpegnathos saltator]
MDTLSSAERLEESSFLSPQQSSGPDKPTMALFNSKNLNDQNDVINFVKMCQQKCKSELPEDFDLWPIDQQLDHLTSNVDKYFPNIPASLRFILPSVFKSQDYEQSVSEKPDWLDMAKFRRGQAFALRYFNGICLAHMISLFEVFTFVDGMKTLILSQKSNTPYKASQRYMSTTIRVKHWYEEDPWDPKTRAHQDIQAVRKMHLAMRRKLCSYDYNQIDENSKIPYAFCPMLKTFTEDLRDSCSETKDLQCPYTMMRTKGINQGEMSGTQFAYVGLIVLYPKKFGIHHVSDHDLDAFCHLWRAIGYLLGIEDRHNFCQGSLQDVQRRSRDFIEYWLKPNLHTVTPEWEHMSMCVFKGMRYYIPMTSYKVYLLYLCDILDLKMPRLHKYLSWLENVVYVFYKFLFDYATMLPFITNVLNVYMCARLNLAENYGPKRNFGAKEYNKSYERKLHETVKFHKSM